MELAWLQSNHPCERQQLGDAAVGLLTLGQQGYPICPTLVIPAAVWRTYQRMLTPEYMPSRPAAIAKLLQTLRNVEPSLSKLQNLIQACATLDSPAIAIRPSLVTQPGIPWALQELWPAQICQNQPTPIAIALHLLWASFLSPHCLRAYRHLHLDGSDLAMAILIQPLAQPIASGQFTQTSTARTLEAIWGLGYGWHSRCVSPDYYAGDNSASPYSGGALVSGSLNLTQHIQGSKHRADYIGQDGQLQCRRVPEAQQNQWVFSAQQLALLFSHFPSPSPVLGQSLWQQLPEGRVEFTHWQPERKTQQPSSSTVQVKPSASNAPVLLQGEGVIPGTIAAPITHVTHQTRAIKPQTILVAVTLAVEQIALLSEAVGLVLEQGSATSHSVIVARELQIPTIVGATGAIAHLSEAQTVVLDADRGWVYFQDQRSQVLHQDENSAVASAPPTPSLPAVADHTDPPTQIQVWGVLNHVQGLRSPLLPSLAGLGLVRAELLLLSLCPDADFGAWLTAGDRAQTHLENTLLSLADQLAPKPLFYRLADWRYPEFPLLPGSTQPTSASSILGVRGIHTAQHNSRLFDVELAALRTACVQYPNISIILPFVRRVSELSWVRDRLQAQGVQPQQLWIMAETPAIAFELAAYQAAGAQGVAIGMNDLTQLTLGIDRELYALSHPGDWCHPAVQESLQRIIQQSHKLRLPCSLCASVDWLEHTTFVENLRDWGITAITTELSHVAAAHQTVVQIERG